MHESSPANVAIIDLLLPGEASLVLITGFE